MIATRSTFTARLRKILAGKRPEFATEEIVVLPPSSNEITDAKATLIRTAVRLDGLLQARQASDVATARERDVTRSDLAGMLAAGIDLPNPHDLHSMASGALVIAKANLQAANALAPAAVDAVRTLKNWHRHVLNQARENIAAEITETWPVSLPQASLQLTIASDPRIMEIEAERNRLSPAHFHLPVRLIDGKTHAFPDFRIDPIPAKARLIYSDAWQPGSVAASIRDGLARIEAAEHLLENSKPVAGAGDGIE